MDPAADINFDFDSKFRARSYTWPQRPSRELDPQNSPVTGDEASNGGDPQPSKDPLDLTAKKSGSRRNAWGNLSYADLITKAIHSSPEKRLTLSQIYDWMVQNVPYFKDKGDSTSSAGWKNSIRHNLSLHSRFMRIQNEGTGKSSWWVLNPDAKPGKTPRRRAGSMEQMKCYEKKRGRIRKKVEALRASLENGILSPNECDDFLEGLNYGGNFRERTSSSTSNCSRLSPISAAPESDISSNVGQSMPSNPWSSDVSNSPTLYPENVYSDLVESLVEGMKLSNHDGLKMDVVSGMNGTYLSDSSSDYSQPSPALDSPYSQLPQTGPYINQQQQQQQQQPQQQQQQQQQISAMEYHPQNIVSTPNFNRTLQLPIRPVTMSNGPAPFSQADLYNENYSDSVFGIKQEATSPVRMATPTGLTVSTCMNSPEQGSPSSDLFSHHSPQRVIQPQVGLANGLNQHSCQLSPQQTRHIQHHPLTDISLQQQALHQAACDSILRDALTRRGAGFRPPMTANNSSHPLSLGHHSPLTSHQAPGSMIFSMPGIGCALASNQNPYCEVLNPGHVHGKNASLAHNHAVSCHGASAVGNNGMGVPLDIDMELMGMPTMDYDMEQVITQELRLEGNLDFIFDAGPVAVSHNVVR